MDLDPHLEANRRSWDDAARIHPDTAFYDVPGFLAGKTSLLPLERREVGDVAGKRLLHLQCHFGLDTLSWARLGAEATGVDFSGVAIEAARDLADRADLEARFVESDVFALPEVLADELGSFDVVLATWGALCWIPDLPRWVRIAASFLRPGGFLYLAEDHPLANMLASIETDGRAVVDFPYFHQAEPDRWEGQGTYADPDAILGHPVNYQWAHHLGEHVQSLVDAGLRVEFLHEHRFGEFQRFEGMTKDDEGRWWLPEGYPKIPLTFSVRASKDA